MFDDKVIGYNKDNKPVYDNTPTVVCVLFTVKGYTVCIRRARNPGKNLVALPGGFQMRGETWEQAGAREVLEETGYILDPEQIVMVHYSTDEFGHNLVIGEYVADREPKQQKDFVLNTKEILELVSDPTKLNQMGDWAFPRHYVAWAKSELDQMLVS